MYLLDKKKIVIMLNLEFINLVLVLFNFCGGGKRIYE